MYFEERQIIEITYINKTCIFTFFSSSYSVEWKKKDKHYFYFSFFFVCIYSKSLVQTIEFNIKYDQLKMNKSIVSIFEISKK